jgi:hypothetical protein
MDLEHDWTRRLFKQTEFSWRENFSFSMFWSNKTIWLSFDQQLFTHSWRSGKNSILMNQKKIEQFGYLKWHIFLSVSGENDEWKLDLSWTYHIITFKFL